MDKQLLRELLDFVRWYYRTWKSWDDVNLSTTRAVARAKRLLRKAGAR